MVSFGVTSLLLAVGVRTKAGQELGSSTSQPNVFDIPQPSFFHLSKVLKKKKKKTCFSSHGI